jgi:hypothetical protein
LSGASVTFNWVGGSGISNYWLSVGNTFGGHDIYNQSTGAVQSATVNSLPTDGRTIYVRLWWLGTSGWQFHDYGYTAANSGAPRPAITTPTPGSILSSANVNFAWTAGTGVSQYWFYVGTAVGAADIYNHSTGLTQSVSIAGLPVNGQTIFVRLWSLVSGNWQFDDYTFTAVTGVKAVMTAPAPATTFTSGSAGFAWSSGTAVSQYWLSVGTTAGTSDVYNQSVGTSQSVTVGTPSNGGTIYVRLWSLIGSSWQFSDTLYEAAGGSPRAILTSPPAGTALSGTTVTFGWTSGTSVNQYWLSVGTTLGGGDIFNQSTGAAQSTTVSGLPINGQIVFVRLWSLIGSTWQFNDYAYAATSIEAQKAVMNSPSPGTILSGATQSFGWSSGSGATQYWLHVGTTAGASDIYNQSTGVVQSATVNGLPTNGTTAYVRLWSRLGNAWLFNDYLYEASGASVRAVLTSPTPGNTLSGTTVTFGWTPGTGVSQYWLHVGSKVGGADIYNQSSGTTPSATVSALPNTGTVYVRLWSQLSGIWQFNDYSYTAVAGPVAATSWGASTLAMGSRSANATMTPD